MYANLHLRYERYKELAITSLEADLEEDKITEDEFNERVKKVPSFEEYLEQSIDRGNY